VKKKIITLLVFGGLLIFIWFKVVDVSQVFLHFQNINYFYIPLVFLALLFSSILRGIRWSFLLKKIMPIKRFDVIGVYMMGSVIDFIIPIRIAEIIKCSHIKKKYKIPISKTFITVIIDKLFDLTPILLIIGILPFVQYDLNSTTYYIIFGLTLILFLGILFVIFLLFQNSFIMNINKKITNKYLRKISKLLLVFSLSVTKLKLRPALLFRLFFLSLLAILGNCCAFYFAIKALNFSMALDILLLGYSMLFLSYAIPAPPVQIGSSELMGILIFTGIFGLDRNFIGAITLFVHALGIFYTLFLGLILFKRYKKDIF